MHVKGVVAVHVDGVKAGGSRAALYRTDGFADRVAIQVVAAALFSALSLRENCSKYIVHTRSQRNIPEWIFPTCTA